MRTISIFLLLWALIFAVVSCGGEDAPPIPGTMTCADRCRPINGFSCCLFEGTTDYSCACATNPDAGVMDGGS